MSDVTRFTHDQSGTYPDPEGLFVRFEDHAAEVARLEAALASEAERPAAELSAALIAAVAAAGHGPVLPQPTGEGDWWVWLRGKWRMARVYTTHRFGNALVYSVYGDGFYLCSELNNWVGPLLPPPLPAAGEEA